MLLCFACLHQFPQPNLTPLNVSDTTTSAFHALRNNVTKLKASATPAQKRFIMQIEDDIKSVALAVDRELKDREDQMTLIQPSHHSTLSAQDVKPGISPVSVRDPQDSDFNLPRVNKDANNNTMNATATSQAAMLAIAEKNISKFIQKAKQASQWSVANRFGHTVSSSARKNEIDIDHDAATLKLQEHLAHALYLITESAAACTKSEKALLWLTSETGDELVSSIWAGVDIKRGMLPLRVSSVTGIVGAVTTTGVAVNATMSDPASRTVLCVPIGTRSAHTDGTNKIHGALQLLNKNTADHYTDDDEALVVQCSAILSHILSSYASCKPDILKRLFDPSLLSVIAKFKLEYNSKVKDELLSTILSHRPAQLLYRSWVHDSVLSRNDIQQKGTPLIVCAGIKEVHHFINTLESSWKNSVAAIGAAQKREDDLAAQLEHARQEIASLKHQNERVIMLTRRTSLYGENTKADETEMQSPKIVQHPPHSPRRPSQRSAGGSRKVSMAV